MKIGIIGAMNEELELLKSKLINPTEITSVANQTFITGKLHNQDVILLKCGIGKVSSAIGTTLMNQLFSPSCIINTGSAGALGSQFNIGDVVIGESVCYHDADLTAFGYKIGQMAQMPPHFSPCENLLNLAYQSAKKLSIPIKKALILSGDIFVNQNTQVEYIKNNFSSNCVVEMESCSIAHVCFSFNIPFLIIRSISDLVEEHENKIAYEKFLPLASKKSAEFVLEFIYQSAKLK
jgi:adenosylhomocysteine nucleosidase